MMRFVTALFLVAALTSRIFGVMEIVVQPEAENYIYDYRYTSSQINAEKPDSLASILGNITEISIAPKGFNAVLGDISVNGGTFEQTAILLDGIKVNDVQTGHFDLDVAVPSIYIGSITVLKNGSSLIGSGGFTGLVDIETPVYDKDVIKAYTEYGTYNTLYSGLLFSRKLSDYTINFSAEGDSSDGYHADTDFYKNTAMIDMSYGRLISFKFGYDERAYGAYDFYTPGAGLNSWEYTSVKYASLDILKGGPLSAQAHIRNSYDHFILLRNDPSYYENRHNSAVYGADVKYDWQINGRNAVAVKYELTREEIQSANLGDHYRDRNSAVVNGYFEMTDNFTANVNASAEKYDTYSDTDFMPSLALVYKITDWIKFNAGYSYSARYPDFTELYYSDPFNTGNPGLKPERGNEVGAGTELKAEGVNFSFSAFYRSSFDLIDWVTVSPGHWAIMNIGKVNTAGYSAGAEAPLGFAVFGVNYTYLDSYRSGQFEPKYGVSYLRNKVCASAAFEVLSIRAKAEYTYKNYINREQAFNGLDITLSRKIIDGIELSLKAENAMNWYFEETPGIPAMGRAVSLRADVQY
jgi:iron complex outermembrane receptor protein